MGLELIPEEKRDAVAAAVGADARIEVVAGGASGASTYRVDDDLFLRIEGVAGPARNPAQYDHLRLAAEAGIAPPIRHLDEVSGVLVLPFIEAKPIDTASLVTGTASLLRSLHDVSGFVPTGDHLANIRGVLTMLPAMGRVAPGLLDEHVARLDELAAAYPWDPSTFVASHNDPNQFNVIFDGQRLWLIDWETSSRNDRFVDLAVLANHEGAESMSDLLLATYLGHAPSDVDRARLGLMQQVARLFAGAILLLIVPSEPHNSLDAPTPEEFGAAIADGVLKAGELDTTITFAKLMLQVFLDGAASDEAARWRTVLA